MISSDQDGSSSARVVGAARLLTGLSVAWVFLLAFFHSFPQLDIATSELFCTTGDLARAGCDLFPARQFWLTALFRGVFYWLPVAALVVMAVDIVRQNVSGPIDRDRLRTEVIALAAYLVGPILLVNGLLKAYSGRPRPVDVTLFGGDLGFVPVADFTGACVSNCSFVSGEAAAAGWLLCLVPLLRVPWRHLIGAILIDISVATPLLRVAMGAHFLSDVILGWLIGFMTMPALIVALSLIPVGFSATLDRYR